MYLVEKKKRKSRSEREGVKQIGRKKKKGINKERTCEGERERKRRRRVDANGMMWRNPVKTNRFRQDLRSTPARFSTGSADTRERCKGPKEARTILAT